MRVENCIIKKKFNWYLYLLFPVSESSTKSEGSPVLLIGTELSGERSVDLSLPSDHDSTEGEDDDLGNYYFLLKDKNINKSL